MVISFPSQTCRLLLTTAASLQPHLPTLVPLTTFLGSLAPRISQDRELSLVLFLSTAGLVPSSLSVQARLTKISWALQKEMAIHSSILAWEIPWTEESGKQQFKGVTKE